MTIDVLSQLNESSWRGITFPLVSRTWDFSQENARHRILFEREQLIESLGGENPMYQYSIPFREGVRSGLFTSVYPEFLQACLDSSDGLLDDPIHGPVQVKCATVRETVDPDRRDGIDVDVGFVKSPDEDFDREELATNISSIQGATDVAKSLDADIDRIDWQQEEKPPPMADGFDIITSVANQLEVAANKPFAAIAYQLERLRVAEESVARLADPTAEPARQKIRLLRMALIDQRDGAVGSLVRGIAGGNRPLIRQHRVQADIGVISLASKLGMDPDQFLLLNPQLRGQTLIDANTLVYYVKK